VLFAAVLTVILAAVQAHAGNAFPPITPEELKMTAEPKAPGAPAIILFREVDRDDNGRTSHEDNYFRVKILTEEGRKRADVELEFEKGHYDVGNIHARSIRPDGSVAEFDGKIYAKQIVKAKGLKYMAKTFTLPDVQIGSIIEYSYTVDYAEYEIYTSRWILNDELFTRYAKFSLKPYRPKDIGDLQVRWSWQNLPAGAGKPAEGPDGIVRLEAHDVPAFDTEDFMPPADELRARVDFNYSNDAQESDAAKYWKNVGKRISGRVENFVGKRKAMEQAVAQIVAADDPQETKLQKIYDHVQKMRNTSFEIRKTEQEEKRAKEKDADNVESVWKQNYGDGVQLTWLFLGLARAAGFEAYGVMVSDRAHYFFNQKLMDSNRLSANVVLVKLNGKDFYFDPGSKFTPFGLLPWEETGVVGMRLDKDGGTWVQTTLPTSAQSRIKREADLKLSDEGDLEGKLKVTYTGLEAARRRSEERNEDATERKKFLEDQIKEYVPAAIEVDLTNQPEWTDTTTDLVAEFNFKVPGWVAGAGKRALMPLGLFSGTEKRVFEHTQRTHPIYFDFPFEKDDDVKVELPAGWQVDTLPKPRLEDGHIIVYSTNVENNKNVVHLTRKLAVDILVLESKYYSALRNFFQQVRANDEEQIVLQPGRVTAGN
jgi:hypothetical protein